MVLEWDFQLHSGRLRGVRERRAISAATPDDEQDKRATYLSCSFQPPPLNRSGCGNFDEQDGSHRTSIEPTRNLEGHDPPVTLTAS